MEKSNQLNLFLGEIISPETLFIALGQFNNLIISLIEKTNWGYLAILNDISLNIITNKAFFDNPSNKIQNNYLFFSGEFLHSGLNQNDVMIADRLVFGEIKVKTNQVINQKLSHYFFVDKPWHGSTVIEKETNQSSKLKNQIRSHLACIKETNFIKSIIEKITEIPDFACSAIIISEQASINQQIKVAKIILEFNIDFLKNLSIARNNIT